MPFWSPISEAGAAGREEGKCTTQQPQAAEVHTVFTYSKHRPHRELQVKHTQSPQHDSTPHTVYVCVCELGSPHHSTLQPVNTMLKAHIGTLTFNTTQIIQRKQKPHILLSKPCTLYGLRVQGSPPPPGTPHHSPNRKACYCTATSSPPTGWRGLRCRMQRCVEYSASSFWCEFAHQQK